MSYEDDPQAVRLETADRDRAQNHAANALRELDALARLVLRTLGQADDSLDGGVTIRLVAEGNKAADEPIDVTVSTFCTHDDPPECLGVYDALKGVCRPCGPGDHC